MTQADIQNEFKIEVNECKKDPKPSCIKTSGLFQNLGMR